MPDVLVRNVEENILDQLKDRANQNGRSLQKELKLLFRSFVDADTLSSDETAAKIRNSLRGRVHSDSAELLRENRQR